MPGGKHALASQSIKGVAMIMTFGLNDVGDPFSSRWCRNGFALAMGGHPFNGNFTGTCGILGFWKPVKIDVIGSGLNDCCDFFLV